MHEIEAGKRTMKSESHQTRFRFAAANRTVRRRSLALTLAALLAAGGCFELSPFLFNPSFVNRVEGGLFPFVPGPENELLFVRVVNSSNETLRFLVTIERSRTISDSTGEGRVTDSQTIELSTAPGQLSNEAGVLFDCSPANPITRVGLGENLNRPTTDPGLLVGGLGDITQGFGVPPNINPLSRDNGDFQCGDTLIYEAFTSANAPGGFRVQAFVLPFESQPTQTARDTFTVAADFLRGRPIEE